MNNVELGFELKRIRKEDLGLTQLEFCEKTKIGIRTIARMECGYQRPDETYFKALESLNYNTEIIRITASENELRDRNLKGGLVQELDEQRKHFSDEIFDLKSRVNYLEQFLKKQMNYQI